MPKISSATVAEHRAAQRAHLLRAGEEVLLSSGLAGFTPTSVTERAGIARSSFYDYFPSRDDLLVAIATEAMDDWNRELTAALDEVTSGPDKLRMFVSATMRMAGDGRHAIAGLIQEAGLSPSNMDQLMALHHALLDPVMHMLTELGVDEPQTSAMLVHGVLNAGVQLVAHGMPPERVAEDVHRLLTRGITRGLTA